MIMRRSQQLLAIDGHDGSGKTTLAKLVAKELGGQYVHPFYGQLGDYISWTFRTKRFELTDLVSRSALEHAIEQNSDEQLLVFDRHWMSMFTVLPEEYHNNWMPLPATVLCWTDLQTTILRLVERGEDPSGEKHEFYINAYKGMAIKYEVPIINTTNMSLNDSKKMICEFARKSLKPYFD